MSIPKIEPWITEEYAQERSERIKKLKAEGKDHITPNSLTKEGKLEITKNTVASALKFNELRLKKIEELGPEEFIKTSIQETKELINMLENPTPEEKYKYTEAYFNDLINTHKDTLKFYEELYQDKDKLIDTLEKHKIRTKKHIEELKKKLDRINNLQQSDIEKLELSVIMDMIDGKGLEQEIELLDGIVPESYIIPNNKLVNTMAKGEVLCNENFNLRINNENKKEILTKVSLNYDDENIQIYDKNKRFTPYDRTVHNAVCSLFEAGNTNFTPDQVYRAMNGLDDQQYVSPQAVGAITRSLDKQRRIYAKIDYTNEAKAYRKDVNSCIVEDYILSAKKITLEAGGQRVTGYKLNSKPILYQYAQVSGQVLTVPSKLLNTKDVIRSTEDVIIIREYLIRRIEVMKKNKDQSNCILLERVYEELNEPEPTKKKALKVRNIIEKLLSKFVSEKYIKNFEFYKEGRAFKGIEIFY